MQINSDEHVAIFGMTGSGKTTFVKKLYGGLKAGHVVVLDVKHDISDLPDAVIINDENEINKYLKDGYNIIFRPKTNRPEIYDKVADVVFNRGNTILVLDEAVEVIPEGALTDSFKRIFIRGRSRRAVCWFLTQRPALISKTAISQAVHTFTFALIQIHDKKAVCVNIPLDIDEFNLLRQYDFFHFRQGDRLVAKHRG